MRRNFLIDSKQEFYPLVYLEEKEDYKKECEHEKEHEPKKEQY